MSNILMLSSQRRYFVYRHKTDMRRGFDGLSQLVREEMGGELMTEDMFIFLNKGRTHIKLLVFEQGGFSLFYRRLEQGTFEVPDSLDDSPGIEVSCDQLLFVLKGVSLKKLSYRPRYQHSGVSC